MVEPGILVTLGLASIGAVVWAVRVEGKVGGHDDKFIALNTLLDEREEHIKERHADLSDRLKRIEGKIDAGFKNGNDKI